MALLVFGLKVPLVVGLVLVKKGNFSMQIQLINKLVILLTLLSSIAIANANNQITKKIGVEFSDLIRFGEIDADSKKILVAKGPKANLVRFCFYPNLPSPNFGKGLTFYTSTTTGCPNTTSDPVNKFYSPNFTWLQSGTTSCQGGDGGSYFLPATKLCTALGSQCTTSVQSLYVSTISGSGIVAGSACFSLTCSGGACTTTAGPQQLL